MNALPAASTPEWLKGVRAILWAGGIAGAMDITAAFLNAATRGVRPWRVLQGIASGLLGPASFEGGRATIVLGGAIHFFIAFTAATIFYLASRRLAFLTQRAVLAGALYGIAVYLFMYWMVIPLSAIRRGPFSWRATIIAILTHIVCVGLPISLAVRRATR